MIRDAAGALLQAQSDAEAERRAGTAWLLGHPDLSRPVLVDAVRDGTGTAPETCLRLLAAVGGEGAVDALETALLRGHRGESFYAAVALAEVGEEGLAVLRSHAEHADPAVRDAVAAGLRVAREPDGP